MRKLILLGTLAAPLMICACSDDTMSPLAPSPQAAPGAIAGEIRILDPAANAVLLAGHQFSVTAEQQVHGGPLQGRGRLEYSVGGDWIALGAEFPWSAQDQFLTVGPVRVDELGHASLRLVVYELRPDDPFLMSSPVDIFCRDTVPVPVFEPALAEAR